MEHIQIKLSIPSGVATVGISAQDESSSRFGWVRLGLGWTMTEDVNRVAT